MSVREIWNMECPKCKSDANLKVDIVIKKTCILTSDGTESDDEGDHIWDDDSGCECTACQWSGLVFQAKLGEDETTNA
jgi:hypothetical protein